jgi:ribose-phosphate pyrophosphokinase
MNNTEVKFFAGSGSTALAERIAKSYGGKLGDLTIDKFSDGELQPSFNETLRGASVHIIQSTHQPHDNMMELLLMIDAAKRASAKEIVAVIPYFGYARQDRKAGFRSSIGGKLMANMLMTAGVSRVMTMDLHADQIQGFFEVPVDHLYSSNIFIPYIDSLNLENLTIAAPDMGGSRRANIYSKNLKANLAICYKKRKKANVIERMDVIGDVEGTHVVLIDDMIDTGGTLCKAADMMLDQGALSIRAVCTHGILSGKAYDNINNSNIKELVVTDTITPKAGASDKVKVIPTADLFASAITNLTKGKSISTNFII